MSSWTATDEAAGAPLWACASANLAPSSANRTDLFKDETADNFITGITIGLYNVSDAEITAGTHTSEDGSTSNSIAGTAHTGWNLRTIGSGGRTGRIQMETIVCLTSN
jgi:hypothetical protein